MLFDLLTVGGGNIAADLLEQTSSTTRVQEIVRLSLAPAFLLAGIGAVMNVMMARLIWIANRIERLEVRMEDEQTARERIELARLRRRRRYAQRAIMLSTGAALTICVVIALLFVSAFVEPQIGSMVAFAWIAAMIFLISGLVLFAAETVIAAQGQKATQHGPDEGS
ncbi:DUF2721 domain-containing protein [Parerythrobacter jejuensis]|uniref:DUF2721 domain-containing protein n=1 Tax=Parerythrobacter jejuensis TaxID=795812 RepID=A0A845AL69_9SPHN|nr:DUF2721 domain-containing protein [Parerythrobacter jejuensis]MXP31512.1 DUF2721 domain-containing protein [Parerythrobacter jejuensis]